MRFQKGQPRLPGAGRKKGSKNIRRVRKVSEVLADQGIDPVAELLAILENESEDMKPGERAKLWLEVISYCQGKASPEPAIDDSTASDEEFLEEFDDVQTDDVLHLVRQQKADGKT